MSTAPRQRRRPRPLRPIEPLGQGLTRGAQDRADRLARKFVLRQPTMFNGGGHIEPASFNACQSDVAVRADDHAQFVVPVVLICRRKGRAQAESRSRLGIRDELRIAPQAGMPQAIGTNDHC